MVDFLLLFNFVLINVLELLSTVLLFLVQTLYYYLLNFITILLYLYSLLSIYISKLHIFL